MKLANILILIVLITFSGCTAGAFGGSAPQERPVTLGLINSANVTHTFEVTVVELPGNVTIRRSDGLVETVDVGSAGGIAVAPGDSYTFTSIEYPKSSRQNGRYILEPNETIQSEITELPADFAIVVAVYQDDRIVSLQSSTCDGTLVYVEVTSRYGGASGAHNCRSDGDLLQLQQRGPTQEDK